MSKDKNVCLVFWLMPLNQSMTSLTLCDCFTRDVHQKEMFMLSRMVLSNFRGGFFEGLMSRDVG